MKRKCAGCGAKFTPERKNQRSCSSACRKARYERSDKARARKKRYETSTKGKAASEKYAASTKGQLRQLRHYYKDRPDQLQFLLKNRAKWTKSVRAHAAKHGVSLLEALELLCNWWIHDDSDEYEAALRFLKWDRFWPPRGRQRFLTDWYRKEREEAECRTSRVMARGLSTSTTFSLRPPEPIGAHLPIGKECQ